MTGRYEILRKINQNTLSVYIAPGRVLSEALIPVTVRMMHRPVTYLTFGHTHPFLSLPQDQTHRIGFRRVEGMSGLIGAIRKDESNLLFIQYSRELFEEYETSIPVLAETCRAHARHHAPVVILAVSHDEIIEQIGIRSDRYIVLTDKKRKSKGGGRDFGQKTLHECSLSDGISPSQKETLRYGQQVLPI
ncbi:MAG TPA: hypothetical protein PK024_09360 [Methanospirillum sp.]|uniref:hypothetical protein n=1 Tax=Methanospirillum sp. TaxID=45200 RepID=UPI002C4DA734|nr:hypothetical protein [Methanospirillum sp.]HOJ97026.1 hypothetical protein [Methanospirillum sp.]HOL40606.1 hypothetical protein [Methanospirillum sp.]HPP76785.1 hypothetical protein [Methanospirillum sp.]